MADGAECFNGQSLTTKLKVCNKYVQNDKCFVIVRDQNTTERGCNSDKNLMCTKNEYCADDYKSLGNNVTSTFNGSCFQCTTEGVNGSSNCKYNFTRTETCPTLLGREPICYYFNDVVKVIRGCLKKATDDIKVLCETGSFCNVTNGNNSNNQSGIVHCIQCDSTNSKCSSNITEINATRCIFKNEVLNKCYLQVTGKIFWFFF